jgi:hypothetical protein
MEWYVEIASSTSLFEIYAAEWYQSLRQDNPGAVITWNAGMNENVNNFEDRFLRWFWTAAMIEAWTIELEQRVQGSDETVEHYVSVLQKLFTRVGGYNEAQKTRKFISGLTWDLYIMVQSTHDETFQNAIEKAKKCEMTLMAGRNKNIGIVLKWKPLNWHRWWWNFQNLSQKLKMKLRKIDPIIMAVIVILDGIEVVAIIITAIVMEIMIEVII